MAEAQQTVENYISQDWDTVADASTNLEGTNIEVCLTPCVHCKVRHATDVSCTAVG